MGCWRTMKTNSSEKIQSRSVKDREPGRLLAYEALFKLNQEFEQVLETLDRLKQIGLFPETAPAAICRGVPSYRRGDTRLGELRADA